MNPTHVSLKGTVQNIFAHRFTLQTANGVVLADLTPHGQDKIELLVGDEIAIEGERKPSEIKVHRILRGDLTLTIEPKKKHDPHERSDREVDPKAAVACARAAGFEVIGEFRRKPKHFEILGRRDGDFSELHIALDGSIQHIKPVPPGDSKWQAEVLAAHR